MKDGILEDCDCTCEDQRKNNEFILDGLKNF